VGESDTLNKFRTHSSTEPEQIVGFKSSNSAPNFQPSGKMGESLAARGSISSRTQFASDNNAAYSGI